MGIGYLAKKALRNPRSIGDIARSLIDYYTSNVQGTVINVSPVTRKDRGERILFGRDPDIYSYDLERRLPDHLVIEDRHGNNVGQFTPLDDKGIYIRYAVGDQFPGRVKESGSQ